MQKINENFITTFKWSTFCEINSEITLNDKRLYDSNFRIVRVSGCPGFNDFKKVLCENVDVKNVLIKSEYLFCLIVDVDFRTINETNLSALKTVIHEVFIESGKNFLIEFYSDSCEDNVRFIFNQRKVTENDETLNVFDKSLLEFGLEAEQYETHIKIATDKGDCLFIRLLKSFNIPRDTILEKKLLKKLVTKNHEAVKAYLDLPIVEANNEDSISPTALTKDIQIFNYTKNKSLLFIAVEGHELDVVKLLLRLGFDINQVTTDGKTAIDFCRNHEIIKFLLNNDAKFPVNFEIESYRNCSESKGYIFEMAVDREKLHAAIKSNNKSETSAFRKKYPNLRMAYIYMDTVQSPYNQSATTTSLKEAFDSECLKQKSKEVDYSQSDFEFYVFLNSIGFRDDSTEIENLEMAIGMREKILKMLLDNLKYSQPAHIAHLRNKTKIGTVVGNDADKFQETVDEIYKHINDVSKVNSEVSNILKVLEHSQYLTIVIDFHSKYVNPMCPLFNKETAGITFANDGNIYLGGRDKTSIEIAATLVHELGHLAVHIAFDNECNPYYANDKLNEKKMSEIVKQIHQIVEKCDTDVIKSVYGYNESLRPRELIVRVPELIMLGKRHLFDDEKLKILFDFFKEQVSSTIETIIREPEDFRLKRDVEQLNCFLELPQQIKGFQGKGIWPNKTQLPPIQTILSLVCPTPKLLLADIFINLVKPTLISSCPVKKQTNKNYYILASVDDFDVELKQRSILQKWKSTIDVTLVLNCDKYNESFLMQSDFFEEFKKSRKIILFGSNEKFLLKISPNLKPVTVQYSWTDIDQNYIEILFQRPIHFQGFDVALNKLIDTDCDVIQLEKLINDRPIEVESYKVTIDNYDDFQYIHRRFTTYRNVDDLLSTVSNEKKTLLLSGVSGCGKSIIFSRICLKIKEKYKDYWVSRINLHEWGETFESIDTSDPMAFLTNILIQTDDDTDRQFQRKLFKKLYQNSRVIVLFDSYDEMNVKYRRAFKLLIQKLHKNVQIWISTRPPFQENLKMFLKDNNVSLQLEDFSQNDTYNCATKFWQNYLKIPNDREVELKLQECAIEMVSLISDSVKAFDFSISFMQPSIIIILAEYYQQHVKEFIFSESKRFTIDHHIDIFDIYKMIVIKKVLILYRQKGSGIAAETAEDFLYQDVMPYLEHLSLISKFGKFVINNFKIKFTYFELIDPSNEFLYGLLQRSGLISISDDHDILFIDDSVSDYFIANFIIRKLKSVTNFERSMNQPEFDIAMKVLCINVINPYQHHFTLIRFIDEGLKHFWGDLRNRVFDLTNIYFNKRKQIKFKFDFQLNFLNYLMERNAIFLLTFFINCFLTTESTKFDIANSDIFSIASGRGAFCIVDMFWGKQKLNELVLSGHLYIKAFQRAFLYFPENKVAAVKDNTAFYQLRTALTKPNEFANNLQTLIEGNFENSTLYFLAGICQNALGNPPNQEQLNSLIVLDESEVWSADYIFDICVDFFEVYIEMKWTVLKELGYVPSTWGDVTKTLFGYVIEKIFYKFNNIVVLKFYNWAYRKETLRDSFKDLVEDTIVRYFHSCESTSGVDEIFQFIRQQAGIDIESIFTRRSSELKEHYREFGKFLPICRQVFTKEEFTAFLTCKDASEEENYFEYIVKNRAYNLTDVLLALHHFQTVDAQIIQKFKNSCNLTAPYAEEMLLTINDSITLILGKRCAVGQGKLKSNQIISSIEFLFSDPLKAAFQSLQNYERKLTIFQSACTFKDMYVMNEVWKIEKRRGLTNDELKNLLSLKNTPNGKTIIKDGESRFNKYPPTIYNTYCEIGTFQFIPFNRTTELPKYAVKFDVDTDRSTYIGRLNGDDDQLCQIIFRGTELTEIKRIPYDDSIDLMSNDDNEFEILAGKGVEWSYYRKLDKKFEYNGLYLWANEHGHISLQEAERYGEHILIYKFLFKDIWDETVIYYKNDYRNQFY